MVNLFFNRHTLTPKGWFLARDIKNIFFFLSIFSFLYVSFNFFANYVTYMYIRNFFFPFLFSLIVEELFIVPNRFFQFARFPCSHSGNPNQVVLLINRIKILSRLWKVQKNFSVYLFFFSFISFLRAWRNLSGGEKKRNESKVNERKRNEINKE